MFTQARDGGTWRIGTDAEVAWIAEGTSASRTIVAAIPPVFEAYATVMLPPRGEEQGKHDHAVLALLREQSADQPWLGYLDTGADDIIFPGAPKASLYYGWHFVLVEAGPEQAATWRRSGEMTVLLACPGDRPPQDPRRYGASPRQTGPAWLTLARGDAVSRALAEAVMGDGRGPSSLPVT